MSSWIMFQTKEKKKKKPDGIGEGPALAMEHVSADCRQKDLEKPDNEVENVL